MDRIKQIYKLNDELKELIKKESELYLEAQKNKDQLGDEKRKATEGDLWEEVRHLGLESEAGKTLILKYPKVFKVAKEREEKNQELQKFIMKEFGFDFRQMTIADYLKLTEEVVKSLMK